MGNIIIHAPTEMVTCIKCGKEYPSRGKYDSGICRECEKYSTTKLKGGPLDNTKEGN